MKIVKKSLSFKTYAKINLSLDVTGRRDDGYHEVAMVMHGIDLYDNMSVRIFPSEINRITLKTDKFFVPVDERNTAYKAAKIVMEEFMAMAEPVEVRIDIKKNIPVAAGLAGGSSNAAGVLIALNSMLKLGLDMKQLCSIGQRIGADVPFCIMTIAAIDPRFELEGGAVCALAEGIGEVLTPLPRADMWVTLAKPPLAVSTPAVYKALDAISKYDRPDTEKVIEGVCAGDIAMIAEGMANSLESVTLKDFPVVSTLKEQLMAASGSKAPTMMSGSGPTVYSLFADRNAAKAAEQALRSAVKSKKTEIFCIKTL